MGERFMTIAEVEAVYPNEWVILDRTRKSWWTKRLVGGFVVVHSAERFPFDKALERVTTTGNLAFLYTGRPDPDEEPFPR